MSNRSITRATTARTIDEVMDEMADDILTPSDPARLGWPATLPIEVAMKESTPKELCADYGLTRDDWNRLRATPGFVNEVAACVEMLKKEGMSFKLKAQLQAEALLKTSWKIIHTKDAPAQVKADLIKSTMKWAGYDTTEKVGGQQNALQINIVL